MLDVGLALAGRASNAPLGSVGLMGRHSPEHVGTQGSTVELPRIPTETIESRGGRHRGAGRGTWRAHRELDSGAGTRRARPPRSHRRLPLFQTLTLTGMGAFAVTTVIVGTSGIVQLDTRPSERPGGVWMEVRPGSAAGAPGGIWVTSPPRPSAHTGGPSPAVTRSAAPRSVFPAPNGSSGSTPPPGIAPSAPGGGSSPSPAADPTEPASEPQPAPMPTTVKRKCKRRG